MTEVSVLSVLTHAATLMLELSAPVLTLAVVVGVLVSIFQAVTQINDSTLTMVPKIVSVFAALAIFGPWMLHQMMYFTAQMLAYVPGSAP